jgi:hypothetical protein
MLIVTAVIPEPTEEVVDRDRDTHFPRRGSTHTLSTGTKISELREPNLCIHSNDNGNSTYLFL